MADAQNEGKRRNKKKKAKKPDRERSEGRTGNKEFLNAGGPSWRFANQRVNQKEFEAACQCGPFKTVWDKIKTYFQRHDMYYRMPPTKGRVKNQPMLAASALLSTSLLLGGLALMSLMGPWTTYPTQRTGFISPHAPTTLSLDPCIRRGRCGRQWGDRCR